MCATCGCGIPAPKTRTTANDTSKVNKNHKFSSKPPAAQPKQKISPQKSGLSAESIKKQMDKLAKKNSLGKGIY